MVSRRAPDLDPAEEPVLTWQVTCLDADRASPRSGLQQTCTATADERRAVAEALDLTRCDRLRATLTVRARSAGRYSVAGRVEADIEQTCVVTLDPIRTRIAEDFAGEFCPAADLAAVTSADVHFDPDSEDEPTAIVDGQLAVGQLIYEHLALAIDPYPRVRDAEAVAIERGPRGLQSSHRQAAPAAAGQPAAGAKPNPFAVLAKLKLSKDE